MVVCASVCFGPASSAIRGISSLQSQTRNVRVGGSIHSPLPIVRFLRQTTIFCDFVGLAVASGGAAPREASHFLSNVFRETDG